MFRRTYLKTYFQVLRMGCDYYIINQVKIEFKDDSEDYNLECNIKKAYFDDDNFDINSDGSDYEERMDELIQNKYLKVTYKPKIIFDKGEWVNEYYKCKYENYLLNLQFNISNILKMTKQQIRRLNF